MMCDSSLEMLRDGAKHPPDAIAIIDARILICLVRATQKNKLLLVSSRKANKAPPQLPTVHPALNSLQDLAVLRFSGSFPWAGLRPWNDTLPYSHKQIDKINSCLNSHLCHGVTS
ncbi:hypothetical protein ACWATR_23975 [Nostoc sp. UIC 10890]